MDWRGDEYLARVEQFVANAVHESALIVANRARERASVPVGKSGGKTIRSRPGEDPRMEFQRYTQSLGIDHKPGATKALAGSSYNVAGFLNIGTSRMAARPNLKHTIDEQGPSIRERIINAVRAAHT
jgi:hypothetical protein